MSQVAVKYPDDCQIAVDACRLHAFFVKIINIVVYLLTSYLLDRHIGPKHKLLDNIEIVFDGMVRVIASF